MQVLQRQQAPRPSTRPTRRYSRIRAILGTLAVLIIGLLLVTAGLVIAAS